MKKLLIVDDERYVVNWLYELLSLESGLDLELFKAHSAKAALAVLAETKIDIVLSDIKMPGMTGLELMGHIYARWPFCRVIILTGYQSFEYIYHSGRNYPEAVYLMKTEDDDVIVRTVKQQMAKIDEEIKTLQIRGDYENMSLMPAQSLLLKNLSDGRPAEPLFDAVKLNMDASKPFLLALGKLSATSGKPCYAQLFEIQSVVRKYVSHLLNSAQWTENGEIFWWLLQPKCGLATQVNTRDLFEDVQTAFDELLGLESSFIISREFEIAELPVKTALMIGQLQGGAGTGAVLMEQPPDEEEEMPALSIQTLEMLETNLFLGKRELFFEALSPALGAIKSAGGMHNSGALELYSSISLILQRHINRMHARNQLAFKTGLYKLNRPDAFADWGQAALFLSETAAALFELRSERKEGYQLQIIGSIKQFVYSNLSSDLSLVAIADKMNYNPSYISRMFKRVEGVNLSDFINAARLAEAKKLLLKDGASVNEVSEAVGYDSPQYFATVFRKLTGLAPHQFQLENRMARA